MKASKIDDQVWPHTLSNFFAIAEAYNLQQRINIDYPGEALRKRATQETGKSRGLFINEV